MRPFNGILLALALPVAAMAQDLSVTCPGLFAEGELIASSNYRPDDPVVPLEEDARRAVAEGVDEVLALKLGLTRRIGRRIEASSTIRAGSGERPAINVLALSTGGPYGAFGSGFLTGWSHASGGRPDFDIVTGLSAGALIAPMAFVGSDLDGKLTLNTGISDDDVLTTRLDYGLLGGWSLYNTEPLKKLIDDQIDQEVLARLAEASETRRLYIGATNLDTGAFTVFDLGGYVASNGTGPEAETCVVEALMATSAIPAIFAPRVINGHTFVDAGIRQHVFLEGIEDRLAELRETTPDLQVDVNIYVVINGALSVPSGAVKPSLIDVATRSFAVVADEGMRQSLLRTIEIVERNGWTLHAIRADRPPSGLRGANVLFSPEETQWLFDDGLAKASGDIHWLDAAGLRALIEGRL